MGTQMSVEAGAQERDMATVRIPVSLPFRNCGNDKSGSFTEAEAYHSFYRKLARRHFNPRARGARRFCATAAPSSPSCFNPRAPRGARPATSTEPTATWEFQPTRPCGARHRRSGGRKRVVMFQSTRPCGARPQKRAVDHAVVRVSIHAPLWGATGVLRAPFDTPHCFNPRAPVGRDHFGEAVLLGFFCFNPRAPVGRDGTPRCR